MTDLDGVKNAENVADTIVRLVKDIGWHANVDRPDDLADDQALGVTAPHLVSVPVGRTIQDVTSHYRAAMEYFKPLRRQGVARLADLSSLIEWANRNTSESAVVFADPGDMKSPSLTCIADYHLSGPANAAGDDTARHLGHRAIYDFPLSEEFKRWHGVSGKALEKNALGDFIEENAKDVLDPTPAMLAVDEKKATEDWEKRLIESALKIDGRFGQLRELLIMSRQFQVHEKSNLEVKTDRDTGAQKIHFETEHNAPSGAPLSIPNLFTIAIPVFQSGALYRLPVRFRYRKSGGDLRFVLTLYNPEGAFEKAFQGALDQVKAETGLPLFLGTPEN